MAIFSKLWITKPSRFILGDNSAETQENKLRLKRGICYDRGVTADTASGSTAGGIFCFTGSSGPALEESASEICVITYGQKGQDYEDWNRE